MRAEVLSMIITGLCNFSIQYNYQSASIALIIMSASVCSTDDADCRLGHQDTWVVGTTSAMILLGSIVGQLSMGYLGDRIGRNMALLITVSIGTLFAFLQCIASGSPDNIYTQIAVFRFFLGIGLGGIYPLSATKASEDGSRDEDKVDSMKTSLTYFWQMPGIIAPWLVSYILSQETNTSADTKWRILYGLGALPLGLSAIGLLVEYYTCRRRRGSAGLFSHNLGGNSNNSGTNSNSINSNDALNLRFASNKSLIDQLRDPVNVKKLIGTGVVWFLYDIAQYGALMTSGQIIREISYTNDSNVSSMKNIENITSKTCIAIACATLSTFLAVLLVPILGLKSLQMASFGLMVFFLLLFASLFNSLQDSGHFQALFALYVVSYSAIHSGQNITTYALPSALFPKEIRSTFNGIACAMSKVGAFLGAFTYVYIAEASGFTAILLISCGLSVIAIFLTHLYIDEVALHSSSNVLPPLKLDSIVPAQATLNKLHYNKLSDSL
jgi:MFS transporter, PHS family, inorganic phosphate transporter